MDLIYEKLSPANVSRAINLQAKLFPGNFEPRTAVCSFDDAFPKDSISHGHFIVKHAGDFIGIAGLYSLLNPQSSGDVWLAWFGVIPEFRAKGFGRRILLDMIDMSRKKGFTHFRLYTDMDESPAAVRLYRSLGMAEEPFDGVMFTDGSTEQATIFSLSLTDAPVIPWNNRPFNFIKYGQDVIDEILQKYNISLDLQRRGG